MPSTGTPQQTETGSSLAPAGANQPKHIPALDGLRGIAILLVLLGHFYQKSLFAATPALGLLTSRIAGVGALGVDLFFALSGFLITGILLDYKDQPQSLLKFYARRTLRIFPLYYGTLIILFLILPHIVTLDEGAKTLAKHQIWAWFYLVNWPTLGWFWDDSSLFSIGHFWSLCVEEHFYLFWPLVVYALRPKNLAKACLLVVVVSFLARLATLFPTAPIPIVFTWNTLQRMDGLALGALLALSLRHPAWGRHLLQSSSYPKALIFFSIASLIFIMMPRTFHVPLMDVFSGTIFAVLFTLVVLGALRSPVSAPANRFLSSAFLTTFGKYSYGLYVIHGVLRPGMQRLFDLHALPSFFGSPVFYQLSYYVATIGSSFALAYLSYHLFEKRFLAMKILFSYSARRS